MHLKLISSLLIVALVTFGVAPCFGMDMDMGVDMSAMRDRQCCEADQCPDSVDRPRSDSRVPLADCCALRTLPDPLVPIERTAAAAAAASSVIDLALPADWWAPIASASLLTGEGPPLRSGVPRFLLLSILLN